MCGLTWESVRRLADRLIGAEDRRRPCWKLSNWPLRKAQPKASTAMPPNRTMEPMTVANTATTRRDVRCIASRSGSVGVATSCHPSVFTVPARLLLLWLRRGRLHRLGRGERQCVLLALQLAEQLRGRGRTDIFVPGRVAVEHRLVAGLDLVELRGRIELSAQRSAFPVRQGKLGDPVGNAPSTPRTGTASPSVATDGYEGESPCFGFSLYRPCSSLTPRSRRLVLVPNRLVQPRVADRDQRQSLEAPIADTTAPHRTGRPGRPRPCQWKWIVS